MIHQRRAPGLSLLSPVQIKKLKWLWSRRRSTLWKRKMRREAVRKYYSTTNRKAPADPAMVLSETPTLSLEMRQSRPRRLLSRLTCYETTINLGLPRTQQPRTSSPEEVLIRWTRSSCPIRRRRSTKISLGKRRKRSRAPSEVSFPERTERSRLTMTTNLLASALWILYRSLGTASQLKRSRRLTDNRNGALANFKSRCPELKHLLARAGRPHRQWNSQLIWPSLGSTMCPTCHRRRCGSSIPRHK